MLADTLTIKNTQLLPQFWALILYLNNQWLIELEEAGVSSSGNLQRKQKGFGEPILL